VVEKKCTSNRDNRTLERIVKQNLFKKWWRVDGSWSQCFKNHHTQMYARHGFQLSSTGFKPLLNKTQHQRRLAWTKDKKDWTAAELGSLMEVDFAFPLEIRVPESGGREERHRIHAA